MMPLSHRKLSAWYHQLAQQLEAGLPLVEALRLAAGTGAPSQGLETMARQIEGGGSVEEAWDSAESWLPLADRLALTAAAAAGRMPRTLHALSARHAQIGAAKLRVALACAYPLAILHLGLLLLPVLKMIDWEKGFQWDAAAYARGLAWTLLPLWAVAGVFWILARRQSPLLARLARMMPALRGYVRAQALADFSFVLGNLLDAGVMIGGAWEAAGRTARSRELQTAAEAMRVLIARGDAPGPHLTRWPCFPPEFAAVYRTGEASGQLEANLRRLAAQNQEAANRSLAFATLLYPGVMFLAVAGAVAYHVILIYAAYLKMLGKMAE